MPQQQKICYYPLTKGVGLLMLLTKSILKEQKIQGVEKARSNKKEKIIERIIAFCQEPHTLQEIEQELGFSDRYKMKRKYINPLLGDVLQMTSVESKNAPTQKYVVISK